MNKKDTRVSQLLDSLKERAKELNCLYQIEELLKDYDQELSSIFQRVIAIIPQGWQYPELCWARITYQEGSYQSEDYVKSRWSLTAPIIAQGRRMGTLEVRYRAETPLADRGPFLKEEVKLINTIASRLGDFIQHQNLRAVLNEATRRRRGRVSARSNEWRTIVQLIRRVDQELYLRIVHKMLNYLCRNGIKEANDVLIKIGSSSEPDEEEMTSGDNLPRPTAGNRDLMELGEEVFDIAERNLPAEQIFVIVQKWLQEDRASFLIRTIAIQNSSVGDVIAVIRRFVNLAPGGIALSDAVLKGARVALIRKFISDQLEYIKIAKNLVEIEDFNQLAKRLIYPINSHGLIGGKSAGLFLAWLILRSRREGDADLQDIKIPKTWYIMSDGIYTFFEHNNLEEIAEQKYKDVGQIRQEYPHVIQLFKNSQFTAEVIHGLSMALDDLGDKPIIVRSSSLLEDRFDATFAGKYKSLFLANQGSKKQRLQALMDAIAEVYSSVFGPDPIEYRAERGLLDFREEMGIIIQEVVGTRVGKYYLPAFAGVAYSRNEFRWSPRIKREDGLLRLVPGLGTRAVDRLSDDYPVLVAPGQPNLRVNVSPDEVIRYSPNKMDVINIETNRFETVEVREFLREYGADFPSITQLISVIREDRIQPPSPMDLDFGSDGQVVTFEGLITRTPFVRQVQKLLKIFEEALGKPVDIEFASDGQHFHLLQCRIQGTSSDVAPAPIPKGVPADQILFTADRYVSNGQVPDISHIVYVDPQRYSEIEEHAKLMAVGRAVSRLNVLLPKRRFILMGPGRWGSRGDIKLGVNATYSDINNTAVLIEIARQKGNYIPDLSFGTHFFQDLVEASIRYLPLYPDEPDIIFNEGLLRQARNILPEILPEYAYLSDVVRVIDVPEACTGKILKVYMNADLDQAMGVLQCPTDAARPASDTRVQPRPQPVDDHSRWRMRMAERIAEHLDGGYYGVAAFYVFGSARNGTAGPGSDLNLLIHFRGSAEQRDRLLGWLDGWSRCLAEVNYLRTGNRREGLLDVHLVTDEDIRKRSQFAEKIGAVTDAAVEIPLTKRAKEM